MNCKKCGNVLAPTDVVCSNCGEPVNNPQLNQNVNGINPQGGNVNPQNNVAQENQNQNLQSTTVQQNVSNGSENSIPNQQPFNPQSLNMQNSNDNYGANMNMGQIPNQNYNMDQPQKKKGNKVLFIIIAVVLVLVIGVLGYFVVSKKLLNNDDNNSNTDNNINTPNQSNNDSSEIANSNTYNFNNFELPIPNSYVAEEIDNLLQLVDKNDKVEAYLYIHQYFTIDDCKDQLDELKKQMTEIGATINSDTSKTIDGVEWIIMDCSFTSGDKTVNALEAFASLGEYHVMEITIYNFGNKSQDEILKEFSDMINNTTYNGTTNFSPDDNNEKTIEFNNKFDFDESIFE